jgi:hypothetical protein
VVQVCTEVIVVVDNTASTLDRRRLDAIDGSKYITITQGLFNT